MGMLDRIKKRHYDGFKEFVLNMETTGSVGRQQIFITGILEDPVFMTYVMKNIRTFEDFLTLTTTDIDTVLKNQDQMLPIFAKCVFGLPTEKLVALEAVIPKHLSKVKEELSYLKEVSPAEMEGAKFFILKAVRKHQQQEAIDGFRWTLPPQDLFYPKAFEDGKAQIFFESGVLAAEGEILKIKRSSLWKHYYDSGKLLAEGEYVEGLKTGPWTYFFANGQPRSKGKYLADLKHGKWTEWDRSGASITEEYIEGAKQD